MKKIRNLLICIATGMNVLMAGKLYSRSLGWGQAMELYVEPVKIVPKPLSKPDLSVLKPFLRKKGVTN